MQEVRKSTTAINEKCPFERKKPNVYFLLLNFLKWRLSFRKFTKMFCIWVAYEPCATASRKQINWIQTNYESKWKVTKDGLLEAFSKKDKSQAGLWVFVNPDNPTGQCYSEIIFA